MSGEFLHVMDFGVRSVPPCEDCWENGHCSMNCGPAAKPIIQISEEEKVSKNARLRASVAKSLEKIAREMRNVAPIIEKLQPDGPAKMLDAAANMVDWVEGQVKNG